MHRQSSHSRPSLLGKRKRSAVDDEDRENINTFNVCNAEKKATGHRTSKYERDEQPSSPLSAPLTPRDVYTDQSLNRILGESCSKYQKLDTNVPLPSLTWAKSNHLWNLMCLKDKEVTNQRTQKMFEQNPGIKPRMRSILLDWIIEVCEVYKMHRETYYLAVDYLDRYLSTQKGVVKNQLQLIGITCLFIASKVEEIYPPKLTEFAYVTDGACQTDQILDKELVILKTLNWNLSSVTVHAWLNLFTQLCNNRTNTATSSSSTSNHSFIFPNHPVKEYLQSAQLVDLSILDEGSLRFSYSVLAASSIYLTSYKDQILTASGLQWSDIAECVEWMSAFSETINEVKSPDSPIKVASSSSGNSSEDSYLIQTHTVDLKLLDLAQSKLQAKTTDICSPAHHSSVILLTPPSSSKKQHN